ncbi:epidermal retinol dehydrogenase 2-like isoform X1 [Lingula anatina]|uniref:Epidermal retinol dehydrogenase 2-like isoform X1 n=1 Tax=Lingula anatina TaxID=7574 RepID=A0A1S3H685_LINAN|nr:epidermal retinol dehydrogenase 2-like isoform X1 [Lingula anatina]XP_013380991.1 epidermal retinol dehydrogenase 2-like isoform X1 [Lingula anatina]|eukprot:XP_013380989.1 epidermal retinol dehydrogenase 2-like isoform X1 [Lingula anatina]
MDVAKDALRLLGQVTSSLIWAVVHFIWPPKKKDISGQLVLIVGDGDLSHQMALLFSSRGARVVTWGALTDQDSDGSDVQLVRVDDTCHVMRSTWSVPMAEKAVKKVMEELGQVDLLITNRIPKDKLTLLEADPDSIKQTFEDNFFVPLWVMKYFGAKMLQQKHGHLVTIATSEHVSDVSSHMTRCSTAAAWVGLADTLGSEVFFCEEWGIYNTYAVIERSDNQKGASERIVKAVLTNQKQVFIPRSLYWLAFLKTLVPLDAMQLIYRWRQK